MTAWAASYVGLPWRPHGRDRDGVDCWGLVWLVYRDLMGIDLPSYAGEVSPVEAVEIAAMMAGGAVGGGWARVSAPRPLDLVSFRVYGHECHVGLALDCRQALHIDEGRTAEVVRLDDGGPWARRRSGFWRL